MLGRVVARVVLEHARADQNRGPSGPIGPRNVARGVVPDCVGSQRVVVVVVGVVLVRGLRREQPQRPRLVHQHPLGVPVGNGVRLAVARDLVIMRRSDCDCDLVDSGSDDDGSLSYVVYM